MEFNQYYALSLLVHLGRPAWMGGHLWLWSARPSGTTKFKRLKWIAAIIVALNHTSSDMFHYGIYLSYVPLWDIPPLSSTVELSPMFHALREIISPMFHYGFFLQYVPLWCIPPLCSTIGHTLPMFHYAIYYFRGKAHKLNESTLSLQCNRYFIVTNTS